MLVRLTYERPQDLVADSDGQFSKGGILVCVDVPLEVGAPVPLEVVAPHGTVQLESVVLQKLGAAGVALSFEVKPDGPLGALVAEARGLAPCEGSEPTHEWITEGAEKKSAAAENPFLRIKTATVQEKIRMAKHGSKGERTAIMRDPNKTLHQYVIRNPHLQLDEVVAIARMTATSPDVLKHIAEKREWYQRSEIATALARNPRTPIPLAVRVLRYVSKNELRQMAKGNGVRMAVASGARKLLLR